MGVTSALLVLAVLLHLALKNLTDALRKARDAQARYERLFDSAPMMYVVTEWQGDVPVIVYRLVVPFVALAFCHKVLAFCFLFVVGGIF